MNLHQSSYGHQTRSRLGLEHAGVLSLCNLDLRRPFGCSVRQTPDRRAAVTVFGFWTYWVAGLEGEVWLDAVNGSIIVVLDLAELYKATQAPSDLSHSISLDNTNEARAAHLSQHFGASSMNR